MAFLCLWGGISVGDGNPFYCGKISGVAMHLTVDWESGVQSPVRTNL